MFGLFDFLTNKKTPEQVIKEQGGESQKGKPGQSVQITGGVSGSGKWGVLHRPDLTKQNWNIQPDGKLIVQEGVEEYQWNDKYKRYDALPGRGRGYLLAENVQQASDDTGGGGGGKGKKKGGGGRYIPDNRPGGARTGGQYMDTSAITGMSDGLINNPKYGVSDWLYQVNPGLLVPPDLGVYVMPGLGRQYKPKY